MLKLRNTDPEIAQALESELNRQRNGIELIASENFVSLAVLEAMSAVSTNKYSEGYPGKRYYGGNQFIDQAENLAIERAKELFGSEYANVQPHAGSQANMEVYFALLELGDKILSMNLAHGGHLTHGAPVSFSGKFYKVAFYGVEKETGRINYDEVRKTAKKEKPKLILAGASAYPREIDFTKFGEIAKEVGAYLMVDMAHIAGLVAAKIHSDPVPVADVVTTTTHKTLRGPRGAMILCKEKYAKQIDKAVMPGMQGGPLEHIIAAKAVAFKEALRPEFKEYQKQIVKNAHALADTLMSQGLKLVSGGADNHLMLVDLTNTGTTGKQVENALGEVEIYCNKNMIPFDERKPADPSGIRLGTPALTTRGFKEEEMKEIGQLIARVIKNIETESVKEEVKKKVKELAGQHALYPDLVYY